MLCCLATNSQATWHNIPEHSQVCKQCCEYLTSLTFFLLSHKMCNDTPQTFLLISSSILPQNEATKKYEYNNATGKITYICVFCFSRVVSDSLQKCNFAWYSLKQVPTHTTSCCISNTWILSQFLSFLRNTWSTTLFALMRTNVHCVYVEVT